MPSPRTPIAAGRFALELDGAFAGPLASSLGGDAVADVVTDTGPDGTPRKRLGAVRYTDIVLTCGLGMEEVFWTWLRDTAEGSGARSRSGAVLVGDFNSRVRTRLVFEDALITEIGFPALDGGSKDALRLTVRIAAASVRREKGDGAPMASIGPKQKTALISNFRVALWRLPSDRVSKVDALTIRQAVTGDAIGAVRDPRREAGALDFSDVVVAVAAVDAEAFREKHHAFVVKGDNGPDQELDGSVELLTSDLSAVLFRIDLLGLGPYALADLVEGGAEAVSRVTARFYCQRMRLVPPDKLPR